MVETVATSHVQYSAHSVLACTPGGTLAEWNDSNRNIASGSLVQDRVVATASCAPWLRDVVGADMYANACEGVWPLPVSTPLLITVLDCTSAESGSCVLCFQGEDHEATYSA